MTREEACKVIDALARMRNDEEHLRFVLSGYVKGKTVQRRNPHEKEPEWEDDNDPVFNSWNYEYRIKPESGYRPFENLYEVWSEMKKHEPFGWLSLKDVGSEENGPHYILINEVMERRGFTSVGTGHKYIECASIVVTEHEDLRDMFSKYTFTDGTPFGIKEGDEE